MSFIEEILNKSVKSKKSDNFSSFLALLFFSITNFIGVAFFYNSNFLVLLFFLGCVISPLIGFIVGNKLSKILFKNEKVIFEKSKLYKELQKNGYLKEFINSIDEEIELKNTIKYSDDFLGVSLLVTKTWFVYISVYRTIVVKTDDILKISEELSIKDSTHYLCLQLKSSKCLRMKSLCYEEIEMEIKNKFPNIMIGRGIIVEE